MSQCINKSPNKLTYWEQQLNCYHLAYFSQSEPRQSLPHRNPNFIFAAKLTELVTENEYKTSRKFSRKLNSSETLVKFDPQIYSDFHAYLIYFIVGCCQRGDRELGLLKPVCLLKIWSWNIFDGNRKGFNKGINVVKYIFQKIFYAVNTRSKRSMPLGLKADFNYHFIQIRAYILGCYWKDV